MSQQSNDEAFKAYIEAAKGDLQEAVELVIVLTVVGDTPDTRASVESFIETVKATEAVGAKVNPDELNEADREQFNGLHEASIEVIDGLQDILDEAAEDSEVSA